MRFLGIDLAWREGSPARPAPASGVAALDSEGVLQACGWTYGLEETLAWIGSVAGPHALAFVDAPLVVSNASGQRACDRQVGQRYGRWKVSANSVNRCSRYLAGVSLRRRLEIEGWRYADGLEGPDRSGRSVSECYPYTTLVGAAELGYAEERPRYKRKPRGMPAAQWKPLRARACDELIGRLAALRRADPPLDLRSHAETRRLLHEPSPLAAGPYKLREDLIDAVLCAWTAALWWRHGLDRCQVLGGDGRGPRRATIIAPARPEQRRLVSIAP